MAYPLGNSTPSTPCNPVQVDLVPQKCNNGWFAGYPVNSSLICYNGPNLPNSGVLTADNLNVVLSKLDGELDPVVLVQTIIQILQTNPALKVVFCEIVNECLAP